MIYRGGRRLNCLRTLRFGVYIERETEGTDLAASYISQDLRLNFQHMLQL